MLTDMPMTVIPLRPDTSPAMPAGQPAGHGQGAMAHVLDGLTSTAGMAITLVVLTALITGLTTYLLARRPAKTDISKRLMYVPLLLVNGAAVYGQVAFFYEKVAPHGWPAIGKVVLAVVIALAIESVSVYVGWHAHDALLNKAGNTAARLRRASYLIAAIVAGINYAHFADPDKPLGLNAAALAFGLLSLLSPWLWGLHTRRLQHVQLRREGVIDATGAVFSGERVRSFPIRAYLARRWSIDHYVTDPRQAWEGYNAELRARWAVGTDEPGWWLRINPAARVRQLTAALGEARQIHARQQTELGDTQTRLTEALEALTAAHTEIGDLTVRLDAVNSERLTAAASLRELTDHTAAERQALIASAEDERRALIAEHEKALTALREQYTADKADALRAQEKALTDEFTAKLAAAKLTNLATYRVQHPKATSPKTTRTRSSNGSPQAKNRPALTDEEAVQAMLAAHPDPAHVWSQNSVRTLTGAGFGARIPKLIAAWREKAIEKAGGEPGGEDADVPRAVNQ